MHQSAKKDVGSGDGCAGLCKPDQSSYCSTAYSEALAACFNRSATELIRSNFTKKAASKVEGNIRHVRPPLRHPHCRYPPPRTFGWFLGAAPPSCREGV